MKRRRTAQQVIDDAAKIGEEGRRRKFQIQEMIRKERIARGEFVAGDWVAVKRIRNPGGSFRGVIVGEHPFAPKYQFVRWDGYRWDYDPEGCLSSELVYTKPPPVRRKGIPDDVRAAIMRLYETAAREQLPDSVIVALVDLSAVCGGSVAEWRKPR